MPSPVRARIYRGTPRNLAFLAARLRGGDIVGVPTETVYGLAGNAFDAKACAKIFRAKGRPSHDPLIVHLHSVAGLAAVAVPNPLALELARQFWPGPLTLVLPKQAVVPDTVTAGLPSVAVRVPSHPLFRRLLKLTGLPLAAPSANPFGYVSPTTAEHVREKLGTKIRYILDGGEARIGLESTIVDLRDPAHPRLLRPGAVTRAELEKALGRKLAGTASPRTKASSKESPAAQIAPGMLSRHYSPRTPVALHESMPTNHPIGEAWVFIARPVGSPASNVFWFDSRGNLALVARRLFAILRQLDGRGFARINVEAARGGGLAEAINDRLRRAAAR